MAFINPSDMDTVQAAIMSRDPLKLVIAEGIIVAAKVSRATPEQRAAAEAEHAREEIEIDDIAGCSPADDGFWVQAWVWVALPEADEEDEEDENEQEAPLDTPCLDTSFHDGEMDV